MVKTDQCAMNRPREQLEEERGLYWSVLPGREEEYLCYCREAWGRSELVVEVAWDLDKFEGGFAYYENSTMPLAKEVWS